MSYNALILQGNEGSSHGNIAFICEGLMSRVIHKDGLLAGISTSPHLTQ